MDYERHYRRLIETRQFRGKPDQAWEKHHVLPKKMGGDDSSSNLVYLTLREHFIAHWLLWRMHRNRETAYSFYMMSNRYKNRSSRAFEEAKLARKGIRYSDESRKKMREKKLAYYQTHEHYRTVGTRMGKIYRSSTQSSSLSRTHRKKREKFNEIHSYLIIQRDLVGNIVKEWNGLSELTSHWGKKALDILRIIYRDASRKSNGFVWSIDESIRLQHVNYFQKLS